ncbi:hypothetical protein ISN45_At02g033030 [Arabidopsis thaliana x Arabidopsis arenosa]|jgi:hypothetical protein|uniref:Uncharacterized protein n=2 Tax=Arabidopsis TaxID=3701 RepID=F4IS02_ARATH|nr:uncharacterized protein AT2G38160 [Arabidopsis thaliana]NP_181351.5 uncharacterized protein AT2G38160 [Arabidopsis thaliana]KAG7638918.1 hypothetical protein ISN45_At02g033030 [Arabidopsis thaliana x Arabidopsis arenosa]AEC09497.1 hypothetical protein AT2G38160 [Arabidopsis thaliana]AEC09498.1 hypothetical protein AT2G38160 [Arabidopsis thaliana]KAG7638919.1 hypothetical protein ISN45_At02g033030 [Arabidopsis thaliana x Arabidopsis arenosa]|eukprot:NP_001189700.1 hypothetical protein AT2G38160 [Arabidopsis thaliana]
MENVVVVRDGDEELSLFLEMRRREKLQGVSSLSQPGANSVEKTSTKSLELLKTSCVKLRRSSVEKFLDSENDKSDYEWLLAAPEITLLGGKENSMVKLKEPKAKSTALKQREPLTRSVKVSKPTPRTVSSKQANTAAEVKPSIKPSRQATPTSRATLPSTRLTNSAQKSNSESITTSIKSNTRASAFPRSSSVGKSVSSAKCTTPKIPETRARPVSTSRSRVYSSGDRSTGRSKISNDVNPVLMGTQMVERVVNMRKLPPPKHDDNTTLGFGRTLSRSSLDMALRHMNIRHSVSKNLRVTVSASTNSMDKNESS